MTKPKKIAFIQQLTVAFEKKFPKLTELDDKIGKYVTDHNEPLTKEEVEAALGLPAQENGNGGGDSITINSNPTYTDNRVSNPSHLTQQEVEALIATRIVEMTPKYQPKQIVYQPAPDGLLPIFKLGDYAPQNSKKANMNNDIKNIIYNGVLDLIYVMRYSQLLIYKGADYTLVQSFSTGGNYAESCVSPNGKRLISANNKSYKWDGTKYVEEATLSGVYKLQYLNSDGKSGILYSSRMRLFTINDFGELVRGAYITTQSGYGDDGHSSITPDAKYVVVSNNSFNHYIYRQQSDGTYLADSQILNADVVKESGSSNSASVAISIDGTKIAIGSHQKGYIYLFNRLADNTWEQQQTIKFNDMMCAGLTFDWKGDKLFCVNYNGELYVADIVAPVSLTLDANSLDPFGDGSLKHFYKLDGNAKDSVGGADLNSSEGTVTYKDAKFDKAIDFNGRGNVYSSSMSTTLFKDKTPTTLSFWYKDSGSTDNDGHYILSKRANSSGDGSQISLFYRISTKKLDISYNTANGGVNLGFTTVFDFTDNLHLITLSMGSDGMVHLYIDGILKESKGADWSGISNVSQNYLALGSVITDSNTGYFSRGTIDHLQIFNRALTQEEVTKLYEAEVK